MSDIEEQQTYCTSCGAPLDEEERECGREVCPDCYLVEQDDDTTPQF